TVDEKSAGEHRTSGRRWKISSWTARLAVRRRHPLETLNVGFFAEASLPSIAPGFQSAVDHAFSYERGHNFRTVF
ncbi:uncharacterized protein METZ01_LOCUS382445, partial [marine metagenome]